MTTNDSLRIRGQHHGELRTALIAATDAILRESGVEGFSLRNAARRAGVSPGAPAHHFGNAAGLLTEVTLLAYEELDRYLADAERGNPVDADPAQELRALSGAYVRFALDHPGRFRLMFRKDLVNRDDPRYREVSERALIHFAWAAARAEGRDLDTMVKDGDFGAIIAAWSTAHGLASLALEDKFDPILPGGRPEFLDTLLPATLAARWPDTTNP